MSGGEQLLSKRERDERRNGYKLLFIVARSIVKLHAVWVKIQIRSHGTYRDIIRINYSAFPAGR